MEKTKRQRVVEDLIKMAQSEDWVASRVGQPGCNRRVEAMNYAESLRLAAQWINDSSWYPMSSAPLKEVVDLWAGGKRHINCFFDGARWSGCPITHEPVAWRRVPPPPKFDERGAVLV